MLNDEWDPSYFVRKQVLPISPKKRDDEKDGTVSKEGTLIKSTVDKAIDSKDSAHQPSVLKGDVYMATVDIKKEFDISQAKTETPLKASLIFPILLEESDPDLLLD